MPSYKLTYFDVRGLGEPARQLFHLAGVEFEDKRITREEFSRSCIGFGHLPVLSVDGLDIPQSAAINRYLAKKFGFAGKTPEEEAWVDAIVEQYKEFGVAFKSLFTAKTEKKSAEEIEKITQEVYIPAKDSYFNILNDLLEVSKSGFLVGSGLTWADLVVVENLVTLEKMGLFSAKDHPKLAALMKKVHSTPKLKEYIASRPDTDL